MAFLAVAAAQRLGRNTVVLGSEAFLSRAQVAWEEGGQEGGALEEQQWVQPSRSGQWARAEVAGQPRSRGGRARSLEGVRVWMSAGRGTTGVVGLA